jgi:hypothetical protein
MKTRFEAFLLGLVGPEVVAGPVEEANQCHRARAKEERAHNLKNAFATWSKRT